ncbi:MAG: asparagine synthase [Leucobacter sp.]
MLAPVEEIVEQGLLVADVAVRMTVKNDIIMNALKRHVDYDSAQIVAMVRDATIDLAVERERDAQHIARMLGEIRSTGRSSWSESDYGSDDNRTLRHRREVYERVAEELRARADDERYLSETAARARDLAWSEIGDSLKERATHPYYSGGDSEEYRAARDDRIQQLIEKDLTELLQEQSAKPSRVRRLLRKDRAV